jgi:hypothetical protein
MPFFVFVKEGGKVWQAGPVRTEQEARDIGNNRHAYFEVKEYRTIDPRRAKAIYAAEQFGTGKPIEEVRARHFKIKDFRGQE